MSASRWSRLWTLVAVIGLLGAGTTAQAQVFKPRGKAAAGKPPASAAARKNATATPAAVPSKQPTRATGTGPAPRRGVTAAPAKKPRSGAKAREDDVVVIQDDDDDDDVTITDDD